MNKISAEMLGRYLATTKTNGELAGSIIDLAGLVARKKQIRMAGKPAMHTSASEEIKKEMEQIAKEIDLQAVMHAYVGEKSKYGDVLLVPSINNDGTPSVVLQERKFTYKVVRYNNIPIYALVWRTITFNRVEYRIREIWDHEKVERAFIGQGNNFIKAESFNAKLPKGIFVKELEYHNLGMLPLVQGFNFPTLNFTTPSAVSDLANTPGLQKKMDNTTYAWQREERNNITRIFLDQGYVDGMSEQQQAQAADADIMVALDGTDSKDGALPITILQGDPKLSEYTNAVRTILELASISGGATISTEDAKSGDGSATGTMFAAATDVETLNDQIITMEKDLRELMVKVYHMKKGLPLNRADMLAFDYQIGIIPNIMTDEIKKTDIAIKKMENGLIDRVQALMFTDNVENEQAMEMIKKADNDEFLNEAKETQENVEEIPASQANRDKE